MPGPTLPPHSPPRRIQFGEFLADLSLGELYHWPGGGRVALQPRPFHLLRLLCERPGELMGRLEAAARLWPPAAQCDTELALNACMRKIRRALGDEAAQPRYIRTLPNRGWVFLQPVRGEDGGATATAAGSRVAVVHLGPPLEQTRAVRQFLDRFRKEAGGHAVVIRWPLIGESPSASMGHGKEEAGKSLKR